MKINARQDKEKAGNVQEIECAVKTTRDDTSRLCVRDK